MDPIQSNPAGVSDINTNQEQKAPEIPASIQARFDQFSAQFHDAQRTIETQNATIAQLMAAQAPKPQAAAAPTFEVQLPEGIDPQLAGVLKAQSEAFSKAMNAQAQAYEQRLGEVQARTIGQVEQLEYAQAVQQVPPAVAQLANQLLKNWRSNPALGGFKDTDAIDHAYGILARQGKLPAPGAQAPGVRRLNQDPGTGQFTASVPDPRGNTQVLPEAISDAEEAKMTPAQRETYWSDRLNKAGGLNQPIVY